MSIAESDHYAGIGECIDHGKTRSLHKKGYGLIRFGNRSAVLLHRVIYIQANGLSLDDIAGKIIRHRCDNTRCINPDHLLIGTAKDNKMDSVERGRTPFGNNHQNSTLTEEIVTFCRENYVANDSDFGTNALARRFGVSQGSMSQAIRGVTWARLPGAKNEK